MRPHWRSATAPIVLFLLPISLHLPLVLSQADGGRRLSASAELRSSFSLPPIVVEETPSSVVGRPDVNAGGPCVTADGSTGSFAFLAEGEVANRASELAADEFALHGVGCGGPGGMSAWSVLATPVPSARLADADANFQFLSRVLTDSQSSDSNWLYFEAKGANSGEKAGVVWCGEGRGVRRWMLLRPVRNPKTFGRSPLRRGGRYVIIDAVDADGKAWTCGYGTDTVPQDAVVGGVASANSSDSTAEKSTDSADDTDRVDKDNGKKTGLGSGEVAGIVAGGAGVLLALTIVGTAAFFWRKQKMRAGEESEGPTTSLSTGG